MVVRSIVHCAMWGVLCLTQVCLFNHVHAQDDVPIQPEFASNQKERLLTSKDATLQISRRSVQLEITNAYQADGVRFLAIKLGFRNTGTTEITVITKESRLIVGQEELLRVQTDDELRGFPYSPQGEEEQSIGTLLGPDTLVVPPGGQTVTAWMVFARVPRTRDLPPLSLKLLTSTGPFTLELSRIENEGVAVQLERIGPSGRVGIARVSGELNAINISHFAQIITQYAEQGVSRLVLSFDERSTIGDELTEEWLTSGREEENERLQFYPVWSGLIRHVIYARLPGLADETGEVLASNEADAVQSVTRDLMPGLDHATLLREVRTGHPLIRRAILFNAGDLIANEDLPVVVSFLNSTDPVLSGTDVRRAAIRALRSAAGAQAVPILEEIVRIGPPEEAVLALKSLDETQDADAQVLAVRLASDPMVQSRVGLASILRTVGGTHDERWTPLYRSSFSSKDPVVRDAALEQLFRLGSEDRLALLQAAIADSYEPIRDRAFAAMLAQRTSDELPLFEQETLNRVKSGKKDIQTLLAVRRIRNTSVLPDLLKWIDEKPAEDLVLVTSYVEVGGLAGLDDLVKRYPDLSPDSKAYLLRALYHEDHPDARRLVTEGVASEDHQIYSTGQELLAAWGDDEAVESLKIAIEKLAALGGGEMYRASQLVDALVQIASPAAMRVLESLRESPRAEIRKLAAEGIKSLQLRSPAAYWLQAAIEKSNSDDFLGAIEILNLALEVEPDSGRVYNSLGFAQMGLARGLSGQEKEAVIKQAKVYFEKSLALSPDDHNPLTGVAICLANEGQYETAIRMVDTPLLITKFSDQSVFLYNAACVYGVSIDQLLKETDTPERATKLAAYQKQAMLFLNAAIEQGFIDDRLLGIDPDLNSLRSLPGFAKLPGKIMKLNQ